MASSSRRSYRLKMPRLFVLPDSLVFGERRPIRIPLTTLLATSAVKHEGDATVAATVVSRRKRAISGCKPHILYDLFLNVATVQNLKDEFS